VWWRFTWLITGRSTGLGRALAEAVLAAGHHTVVTVRDTTKVDDLAKNHPAQPSPSPST